MTLDSFINYLQSIKQQYGSGDFDVAINGQTIRDYEDFIDISYGLGVVAINNVEYDDTNYTYGYNLTEDMKHLYGEKWRELNRHRCLLFNSLLLETSDVSELGDIIQKPIPVSEEEFNSWVESRNKVLRTSKVNEGLIEILDKIEELLIRYHVRRDRG